jgi:cell division protein FtsN
MAGIAREIVIQAGSFKSRDNADRARSALGRIAAVDVAPIEVGGQTYFRVRVGPFSSETEAAAALVRVTQAGYQGAKIVMKN